MGRIYVASGDFASGTAAGDMVELNAPADAIVIVHGFNIGQSSTTTDEATALIVSRASGSGSGGTAITARPLEVGMPAFGGTIEEANTTDGTGFTDLFNYPFSVLAGLDVLYTPETRPIISPSGRLVWRGEAFTAGVDLEWSIIFEEIGG